MKVFETKNAPAPVGPYSQAVEVGGFLFCSGQVPIDPQTGEVFRGEMREQADLVMKNLSAVLLEAGLGFRHVVKATIFLKKMSDFAVVNEVYASYLEEPFPARACVAVSELPKGVDVEIEVIARRS